VGDDLVCDLDLTAMASMVTSAPSSCFVSASWVEELTEVRYLIEVFSGTLSCDSCSRAEVA